MAAGFNFFPSQTTCHARGIKPTFWLMHADDDDDDHYANPSPQKPPTKEVFVPVTNCSDTGALTEW